MRKIKIAAVLLMLLIAMIPANADPSEDPETEKIKIAYIYSGGVTLFNNAAEDSVVKKYAEAIGYQGKSKGDDFDIIKNLNLDDVNVILLEHLDIEVVNALDATLKTAALNGATIISITGNTDDYATDDVDPEDLENIIKYVKNPSESNFKNLILKLSEFKGLTIEETIASPVVTNNYGIYHPDSKDGETPYIFKNAVEYMEWYKTRTDGGHVYDPEKPTIGVIPSSMMNNVARDSPVWNYFVRSIESRGYNVIVGTFVHNATKDIGESANLDNFIIDGEVVIDSAIAISRGGRFFSNAADIGTAELAQLNVPILHGIQLYDKTLTEESWRESNYGVIPDEHYQLAFGEQDGLIEPIVIALKGEDGSTNTPVSYQADWMTERAIGWANLAAKENADKKIVIPYYAAEAGKVNVGSDPDYYLDAPASILNLLNSMKDAGYDVGELPETPEELKDLMIENGYNIGTWAPGSLEKLVQNGTVKLLPVEEYIEYFNTLPEDKRNDVTDENMWGEPPGDIMVYESGGKQYFVIPVIEFGNVMLTPHPLRGRDQSLEALTHVGSYPPTHQTLAAYYYFRDIYEADALLPVWSNLGVMPGNEASLDAEDWTALMIGDLPHIHMLPMDATGVTDKRRANMLVIDFLTPYMLPSGLYGELEELETQTNIYDMIGTGDPETQAATIEEIQRLCRETEFDAALNLNWDNPDEAVRLIQKQLRAIKGSYIPYGDHILGVPPTNEQIFEMTEAMLTYNEFYAKINGADLVIQMDELIENKYGSGWESKKEDLLREIFSSKTPKEAIDSVLGAPDSHIEYALTMALIYKLGLENEKPTEEQAFAIADTLLSYDIYVQVNSSANGYKNLDTALTELYEDGEAEEMKGRLIQKVVLDGEYAKTHIVDIFGEEVYTEVSADTKQLYGKDLEQVLKTVQVQINSLNNPTNEIDSLLNALDGKYIPTGQTGDPIQNFEAVPTGRTPVQDDTRLIPTKAAYTVGGKLADLLIETYQKEHGGAYPEKVAFLLWAVEAARTGGTNEGEIFQLLGVEPKWQANGRLPTNDAFNVIPASELGRPRIDVVVETSGSYRDSYSRQVIWINQAVKAAAQAPDSEEYPNYVKRNSDAIYAALLEEYGEDHPTYTPEYLRELSYARVFGPPSGEYTPGIENIAGSGLEDEIDIADLYIQRMSHIYGLEINGKTLWGEQMPSLLENNLKDVDMGVFSRSSNLFGLLDHPMVASYFGGLAAAITASGGNADMYINNLRNGETDVQSLSEFLNADLNSRYLNPTWIEGMMNSGYAGTAHMEELFSAMGVWEMAMPDLVTDKMWSNLYETYMNDSKETGVTEYLKNQNAYAYQSMTASLLNSIYNGDWESSEDIQKLLEKEYIEQTILNGVVCCHHTCSNMEFNAKIVEGLLSMDISDSEKQKYLNELNMALGQDFNLPTKESGSGSGTGSAVIIETSENDSNRTAVSASETVVEGAGFGQDLTEAGSAPDAAPQITGYEMVTQRMENAASSVKDFISNPTVSTSSFIAIAFVILVIGAVFYGFRRKGI